MPGTVSTLQDFPWEESVQAVKDSLSFDSYPAFAEHVFHTLPQNSPQTRRRYANLIGRWFFPDRRLPGFPAQVWAAYADEKILRDVMRVYVLSGGAWGTLAIEYDSRYELKGRIYPFFIREFRPFQITRLDLDDYVEKRRRNYQTHVAAHVDFGKMTGRNQDALKKTTAGLFKLVFPHRTADDLEPDELQPCLSLATECRQRVLDQLAVMLPEEFGGTKVEVQMQG